MSAQHTPGPWTPKQQVGFNTGRPGSWLVERVNPASPYGIETMHDKRGAFVFRTEAEALAAIAAAEDAGAVRAVDGMAQAMVEAVKRRRAKATGSAV